MVPAFAAPPDVKALFAKAQAAYNKGEFADALKLYSETYDLKQSPNLLFNMAQCSRLLGDFTFGFTPDQVIDTPVVQGGGTNVNVSASPAGVALHYVQ